MDSSDFYSKNSNGYRNDSDHESILSDNPTDLDVIKQLIITNIFPEVIPGIRMHMVSLRNKCSVQAEEPSPEDDEGELVEEISQIDPFIERMLQTRRSFAIGNERTGSCIRISMIKPNDIDGVSRTLTRKKIDRKRDDLSGK